MLSNHAGGVVIPFPRPFRAPPPAPPRPWEARGALPGILGRPSRDWRRATGEVAVLVLLGAIATLQVAVLARMLGVCGP